MKDDVILDRRIDETTRTRQRIKDALNYHLAALEKEDELSAKDRIELIGRLLPFAINKIMADKEKELGAKQQGDPLAGY